MKKGKTVAADEEIPITDAEILRYPHSSSSNSSGAANPSSKAIEIFDRLEEQQVILFYQAHNPDKLSSVQDLLQRYKGQYSVLLRKLYKKYGVQAPSAEPLQSAMRIARECCVDGA